MNNLADNIPAKSHMIKFRLQISVLVLLLLCVSASAQNTYKLNINGVDKDSATIVQLTGLQTGFANRSLCEGYIDNLQNLLQSKGYVTASLDSIGYQSTYATINLFIGEAYKWAILDAKYIQPELLNAVAWREKVFANTPMDFAKVAEWQDRILNYLENNGFPFAKVYLDSIQLQEDKVSALLRLNRGPLYKIDSLRVYGNAKIAAGYLQKYLDITNGSVYSKEKLLRISKKISELSYVEEERPADLTRLATGSVVNLYLKQKKSSQVNFIIGFLPNNDQLSSKKLLITGEGNLNLKNALGSGETIGLNFQALQVASQRLNFIYQQPYIFKSPFGLDLAFDIFRKDSSFVNINLQLGAQYVLNNNQTGKVFLQRSQTIVSQGGINAPFIIQNRRLPEAADVSTTGVGIDYEFNNTDYRFNPKSGNEIRVITSVGTKAIKKNNEVTELKDPSDPGFDFETLYDTLKLKTYQFRIISFTNCPGKIKNPCFCFEGKTQSCSKISIA